LDKQIESVVEILREGRCALASALAAYKYIIMYGQLEGIDNVIMAFFRINLTEYAWAFMDGFWVISMSFTIPLAQAARKLSNTRPTASLLGAHTVASLCGVLFSNVAFVLIALSMLYQESWMQCRKWRNLDVSNLQVIGDNYESEVIFLVTGYQFLSTAMAYNFGYEFRQSWLKNYKFVTCVCFFTALHFYVTLVPGRLSCFWRVNCTNKDLVYSVSLQGKIPIQNPYASTIMPLDFRVKLIIIMVLNTLTNIGWDFVVVNGVRRHLGRKRRREVQLISAKSDGEVAETV
jgi:magnesium-transporting ATPase (P-type)